MKSTSSPSKIEMTIISIQGLIQTKADGGFTELKAKSFVKIKLDELVFHPHNADVYRLRADNAHHYSTRHFTDLMLEWQWLDW